LVASLSAEVNSQWLYSVDSEADIPDHPLILVSCGEDVIEPFSRANNLVRIPVMVGLLSRVTDDENAVDQLDRMREEIRRGLAGTEFNDQYYWDRTEVRTQTDVETLRTQRVYRALIVFEFTTLERL
jgi:hypothetical protein